MSEQKMPRMDKSRYYSTVHGERESGDPMATVHYYQDGLPYDASGFLVLAAVAADKRKEADALIHKSSKTQKAPKADGDHDPSPDQKVPVNEVNLVSWLRGEAEYPWFMIPAAIRARYNKNVSNKNDAVAFLVEAEKLVTVEELAPPLRASYQAGG